MSDGFDFVRSAVSGAVWPGLPAHPGALLLALQFQLEHTQWWPAERLAAHQWEQLRIVLRHAVETVPFYRERLGAASLDPAGYDERAFRRLPLLTRRDIQLQGERLLSTRPPAGHGPARKYLTGGSTGEPVCVTGTALSHFFSQALSMRDHLWHRRDLSGKLCAIRSRVEDCALADWGPPTDAVFTTGPSAVLDIRADIDRQLDWLRAQNGDYLLSHPTHVRELAKASLTRGIRLPRLKEVRTFGEVLPPGLRTLCRDAWAARLTDLYSAEEVGTIALQCPQHEHYHLQSENLLVEVLDNAGEPCPPGQVGRVVITTLHNFAMPLIRYELGDFAEAGAPCACGRGLPVLTRIYGRQRNMAVLPDGRRHWPSFPRLRYAGIAPIRQIQVAQRTPDSVEARYVAERALTADEERGMIVEIQDALGYPFAVTLRPMNEIARPANMKFEDFKCDLPADPPGRD